MKYCLITFYFFLISSLSATGQTNDTIYLKEVQIEKKQKRKSSIVKTNGTQSSLTGELIKSALSRIDNIPSGKISSIKFYFNHSFGDFIKGKSEVDYKDLELGLLIYSVNEDGSIGKPLMNDELRFNVAQKNRGSLQLDLTPLNLDSEQSMYFGFEIFTKQIGKNIRIMVEQSADNPKTLFIKSWTGDKWNGLDFGEENLTLKMSLKITDFN